MSISELTDSQIIHLLHQPYTIGYDPNKLRAELKKRNKKAFLKDREKRLKTI